MWPIHDYGAAAWNTTAQFAHRSPYSTHMYTDFIAQAYNAGYEFVTLEDLASRIAAQREVRTSTPRSLATRSPRRSPIQAHAGDFALDVVNQGTQVIQNVTNWYAYDSDSAVPARRPAASSPSLSAPPQDDVTHIAALPMRGDLLSVTGDGLNLSFSMVGEGHVLIDLGRRDQDTPSSPGRRSPAMWEISWISR